MAAEIPRRSTPWPEDADDDWIDELRVEDPAAIALLTDRRALTYLLPFLRAEHTLSSVAAALGRAPSTIAYWIPRFVAARLLEHRGNEARAGRAMPRYRGAARSFVIPYASVPFDARVSLLDGGRYLVMSRLLDGVDEELERSGDFALRVSAPPGGGMAVHTTEGAEERRQQPFTDSWFSVRLTHEDAIELSEAMDALLERFMDRDGPTKYYGHVGFAREARRPWRSAQAPKLP